MMLNSKPVIPRFVRGTHAPAPLEMDSLARRHDHAKYSTGPWSGQMGPANKSRDDGSGVWIQIELHPFEHGHASSIAHALGTVARSRGMTELVERSSLTR